MLDDIDGEPNIEGVLVVVEVAVLFPNMDVDVPNTDVVGLAAI